MMLTYLFPIGLGARLLWPLCFISFIETGVADDGALFREGGMRHLFLKAGETLYRSGLIFILYMGSDFLLLYTIG